MIRQTVQRLDNINYDFALRRSFTTRQLHDTPIVIVDIDESSLKVQGRWPWPRNKIAELINKIYAAGATVVALDMAFPETEPNNAAMLLANMPTNTIAITRQTLQQLIPQFNYDALLAQSLQKGDSVLGMTLHNNKNANVGPVPTALLTLPAATAARITLPVMTGYINNIAPLNQAARRTGFINAYADADGIIRHATLLLRYGTRIYPALALAATQLYLLSNAQLVLHRTDHAIDVDAIRLGQQLISLGANGRVLIPFRGPAGSFTYIAATDILQNKMGSHALQNKLVFVGTSAFGLGDLQTTAVGSAYPGVELNASIAAGILQNHFPSEPNWSIGAELLMLCLLGFSLAIVLPYLGPRWLIAAGIALPFSLISANTYLFNATGIVLSITLPVLLSLLLVIFNMAYGYWFENRQRTELRNIFGQYLAPAYIETLLKQHNKTNLAGESRTLTVLFTDIRNFTSIAETMSATAVKSLLNQLFTPLTEIIFQQGGTIDKYVGDMLMAFWGAPLTDDQHATHAVHAALAMQAKLRELQPMFIAQGLTTLHIGIGINTGLMHVGDMGSAFRRAYTVIGDAVNIASRSEALTKYYGVPILVGAATQAATAADFIFREIDNVRVKGKTAAVMLYEPLCARADLTPALQNELAQYETALATYHAQRWQEASALFATLVTLYPETTLYKLYLDRSLQPTGTSSDPTIFTEK